MLRAALLAVTLAAVMAPVAHADVVVGRSVAGVRLDMTSNKVRAVLGAPVRTVIAKDEIQGSVKRMDYGLTRVYLGRQTNRVYAIHTTSRRQRTSRGVGVGSTKAAVLRLVRGVRCETFGTFTSCHVGELLAGRKVTDFALSRAGRVTRVTLGYVID
jgi:hypothetical protein